MDKNIEHISNSYDVPDTFYVKYKEFIENKKAVDPHSLQLIWSDILKYAKEGAPLDSIQALSEAVFSLQSIAGDDVDTDNWNAIHDYAGQLEVADSTEKANDLLKKIEDELNGLN